MSESTTMPGTPRPDTDPPPGWRPMEPEGSDPALRWRNRRRMAWCALVGALAYPLLALAAHDGTAITAMAGPFYLFVGAVVGAYIGFSTVDDKWREAVRR